MQIMEEEQIQACKWIKLSFWLINLNSLLIKLTKYMPIWFCVPEITADMHNITTQTDRFAIHRLLGFLWFLQYILRTGKWGKTIHASLRVPNGYIHSSPPGLLLLPCPRWIYSTYHLIICCLNGALDRRKQGKKILWWHHSALKVYKAQYNVCKLSFTRPHLHAKEKKIF